MQVHEWFVCGGMQILPPLLNRTLKLGYMGALASQAAVKFIKHWNRNKNINTSILK